MSGHDENDEWSVGAIKDILRRQIQELESTVNPMLRGGANPDDNEQLRGKMTELESLRRMLAAADDESEDQQ